MYAVYGVFIRTKLTLKSRRGIEITAITSDSIKAGNLKRLLIGECISDEGITPVQDEYPPSKTVEELSLKGLYVNESRILAIVALYPNLQILDVSSTKVSGVAVKHFVESGVRRLKINECQNISPDAVAWARGKGVEVEFDFPSRRGGKKLYRDSSAY